MSIRSIVVLTGAGVSAESGLATFRGPDGLWEGHRVEDVCTPQAFERDPALVRAFYDARRVAAAAAQPNAAHRALARLDSNWPGELLLVTQNVDDLHERAGSRRLVHMHGQVMQAWCLACDTRAAWEGPMCSPPVRPEPVEGLHLSGLAGEEGQSFDKLRTNGNICPVCHASGELRPDIVWFGEMPYEMERIEEVLRTCDLFVSVGTSGAVYPAAGFVQTARYCGAKTLEINLEPSLGSTFFDQSRIGEAGALVPDWVEEILGA